VVATPLMKSPLTRGIKRIVACACMSSEFAVTEGEIVLGYTMHLLEYFPDSSPADKGHGDYGTSLSLPARLLELTGYHWLAGGISGQMSVWRRER
jgi:hypothetical protein